LNFLKIGAVLTKIIGVGRRKRKENHLVNETFVVGILRTAKGQEIYTHQIGFVEGVGVNGREES